mgnify:CR=1 FL=1
MNQKENHLSLEQRSSPKWRYIIVAGLAGFFVFLEMGILSNAFEAHVVNVTAQIENYKVSCPAYSIDEWRDGQGCTQGYGSSLWASEVNQLSSGFSSFFSNYSGEQICQDLVLANCEGLEGRENAVCWATAHTLVNELNLVSNRLAPDALVAGGFDGNSAFGRLGINADSTVLGVATLTESILANASSTALQLRDAMYVSRRVHFFYNYENPLKPQCVFDLDALPTPVDVGIELEVEVEATSTVPTDSRDPDQSVGNIATTTPEVATTTVPTDEVVETPTPTDVGEDVVEVIEIELPGEEVATSTEEEIETENEEEIVEEPESKPEITEDGV